MFRPEIALHKKNNVMKGIKNQYLKRTQKDYTIPFKLSVVSEVELDEISVNDAKRKYGVQGGHTITTWL